MNWLNLSQHWATKQERLILGVMSGTSLDGLDVGLCRVSGDGANIKAEVVHFECYPFSTTLEQGLRAITSKDQVDTALFVRIHTLFSAFTSEKIQAFLAEYAVQKKDVDVIAFHGHTLFHIPSSDGKMARTFQLGEADYIAHTTGIPVLSDFRQKHIAAGGEGAPLAGYLDELLFQSEEVTRVLVNLGGMANITVLSPVQAADERWVTDTGPANKLLDIAYQKWTGKPGFDAYGNLAASGKVIEAWLEVMMQDAFIQQRGPKSTGAEYFNLSFIEQTMAQAGVYYLATEDVLRTLCAFTARSLAKSIAEVVEISTPLELIVSGGGVHNLCLMEELMEAMPDAGIMDSGVFGVPVDAKETLLFAVLANESIWGNGVRVGTKQGVRLGKLAIPD